MSNLKILKQIYNSNRFIKIIIFIQIICSLMMTITFYNRYISMNKLSSELENSPFKNSIVFMGMPTTLSSNDNLSKEYMKDKDKIYEYCKKHPETFVGVTPKYTHNYFEFSKGEVYPLEMLDENTMKFAQKYFDGNYSLEAYDDMIPVVVQNTFKDKYKVGQVLNSNKAGEKIQFVVRGYYVNNLQLIDGGLYSVDSDLSWGELFQTVQDEIPNFIALENEKISKLAEKNTNYELEMNSVQSILFLNEKATNDNLNDFKNFIEKNRLGYYAESDSIFKRQNEDLEYMFNTRFDTIVSFISVLILTIITIGYVNKNRLENRYKVYYLNGLSTKNMYILTVAYYSLLFIIPIIFYNLLFRIFEIDYVKSKVVPNLPIFYRMILDDYNLHFSEMLVLSIVFIFIILIISYWPVKNIKSKYSRQKYEEKL